MKLPISLSSDSREPIYHQIENQIKAMIAGGHLETGIALPSIRVLSKDLGVSVITTRRAYQNLEQEGYIQTIQGKGTFVAKVDAALKSEVRMETVQKAMNDVIDSALRHEYSYKEIETMFKQLLLQRKE